MFIQVINLTLIFFRSPKKHQLNEVIWHFESLNMFLFVIRSRTWNRVLSFASKQNDNKLIQETTQLQNYAK